MPKKKSFPEYTLTIVTRKDWCFTQFSTGMARWLLLIFFMFTQLSSMSHGSVATFHCLCIYRCLKNVIHQINSKK